MEVEKSSIHFFADQLFSAVEQAKDDCSNDNLHDLRLNIKLLKSFCALCEHSFPDDANAKSLFQSFKKLFRHAGKLRDNHQLEKKMKHFFTEEEDFINEIHRKLKDDRENLKDKFLNRSDKFNKEEAELAVNKIAECLLMKRQDQLLLFRSFASAKFAISEQLINEGCDKEQLHFIRSQLKQVFLLHKFFKTGTDKKNILPQIDHIQEELGALHDNELLYKYVHNQLSDKEIDHAELNKRLAALNKIIEKLRIDCLKKLSLLMNISHF